MTCITLRKDFNYAHGGSHQKGDDKDHRRVNRQSLDEPVVASTFET